MQKISSTLKKLLALRKTVNDLEHDLAEIERGLTEGRGKLKTQHGVLYELMSESNQEKMLVELTGGKRYNLTMISHGKSAAVNEEVPDLIESEEQ